MKSKSKTQIEKLQEEKEALIDQCRFEEAQQKQEQIDNIRKQKKDQVQQVYIDRLIEELSKCGSRLERNYVQLEDFYGNQERDIRVQISDIFHQLQITHIADLIRLQKEALVMHINNKQKPLLEVTNLQKKAQQVAMNHDYDQATQLKDQAAQAEEQGRAELFSKLDEKFKSDRAALIESQKQDMRELTKQLKTSLDAIMKSKNEQAIRVEKAFKLKQHEILNGIKISIKKEVKDPIVCQNTLKAVIQKYKEETEGMQTSLQDFKAGKTMTPVQKTQTADNVSNVTDIEEPPPKATNVRGSPCKKVKARKTK